MVTEASPVISVQKTGGFVGASFNLEQKLDELKDEQKTRLGLLITVSGLRDRATVNAKSKNARDVFSYSFILREGDTTYSASFDDTTLTPAYRELFQYIQELDRSR
jgi:hypothetical protein